MENNEINNILDNNINTNREVNNDKKNNKGSLVIIVILLLFLCLSGVYIYYLITNNNSKVVSLNNRIVELENKNKELEEKNKNLEDTPVTDCDDKNEDANNLKNQVIFEEKITSYESTGEVDYWTRVELSKSGDVILTANNIKNEIIASNVTKAIELSVGQWDICGGFLIGLIKENKTLSIIDISHIYCNENSTINDIKIIDNINNLTNIIDVYNKSEFVNQYEPYRKSIIVKDDKGNTIDISNDVYDAFFTNYSVMP